MTPERWDRIKDLFEAAVHKSPADRDRFLAAACVNDEELRHEVRQLLMDHDHAGSFLEQPLLEGSLTSPASGSEESNVPERIGNYRIISKIGSGGMGAVYRCLRDDGEFVQEVAIKLIKRGLDTEQIVHLFHQERQILAQLQHEQIARLLDGGSTPDGLPYFVMECVHGERIDDWCRRRALSCDDRVRLFRKVCDAVSYAHHRLVIHRDLKPGNILVTEDGVPKLLDFGVAKVLRQHEDGPATRTVLAPITPEYASPEQSSGKPVSTATDIYSLGVILYELLTDTRPSGENIAPPSTAMGKEGSAGWWARARSPVGRMRRDLDTVVLKALRREPDERYASVEQFSADLDRYLQNEPILARPATLPYRTWKFVLRHKTAVSVAAALAAGLLATTGWALRQTYVANQQRARAEQRFRDTRQLANTLLFRVHDAIKGLPGAMNVREEIVREAVRYLDTLSAAAAGDLQLRSELARGYRRLANFQGDPFNANKGDVPAALASIRKAVQLQESVVAAAPRHIVGRNFLADLYDDESRLLQASGKKEDARTAVRRSLEIKERVADDDPAAGNRFSLAVALLHSAGHHLTPELLATGTAQLERSIALFDRLDKEGFSSDDFRSQHAFAHKRFGAVLAAYSKDYVRAGGHYREALSMEQAVLKEHPEKTDLRFNTTFTESDLAFIDAQQGRLEAAVAGYRRVLAAREAILAADPADVRARHGLASTCVNLSLNLQRLKRFPEAASYAGRSVEISSRLSKADEIIAATWRRMGEAHLAWAKAAPANAAAKLDLAAQYYRLAIPAYRKRADAGELVGAEADSVRHLEAALAEATALRRR